MTTDRPAKAAKRAVSRVAALSFVLCTSLSGCLKQTDAETQTPNDTKKTAITVPKTAQDVIDRYLTAIGGADKVAAISQRTIEAKLVFKGQENCAEGDEACQAEDVSGQYIAYSMADGRSFRRIVVGQSVDERGYDGKSGWRLQIEPPLLFLEDEQESRKSGEDNRLHWYLGFEKRSFSTALLTPRELDFSGKPRTLDGISWTDTTGVLPMRELWFDRQTGLLYAEIERAGEGDQQVEQRTIYENYQAVDGILVAHLVREITASAGLQNEVELRVQLVSHQGARDDVFAIPPPPSIEPQPDMYLDTLATARSEAAQAPSDVLSQVAWARRAYEAAHFEDAALAAKKTLAINRKEPEALWIAGRTAILMGQLNEGLKYLAQAKANGLNPAMVSYNMAFAQIEKRDYKGAAQSYREAGLDAWAERYDELARDQPKIDGPCLTSLPIVTPAAVVVDAQSGDATFPVLFDTSVHESMISASLAKKLFVETEGQAPLDPQGEPVSYGRLPELRLGDQVLHRVPVVILPDELIANSSGSAAIGFIAGVRTVLDYQVQVDMPGQRMTLVRERRNCKTQLAAGRKGHAYSMWLAEARFPFTRASMVGSEGVFLLSTGMRGAALTANLKAFARAGIAAPPIRSNEPPMLSLEAFTFIGNQALSFSNVPTIYGVLQNETSGMGHRFDGIVGFDMLRMRRVTFDWANRMFYIEQAAPQPVKKPAAAAPAPAAGPAQVKPATAPPVQPEAAATPAPKQ